MRTAFVYKITSPIGRIYIGSTIDINKRLKYYRKSCSISQIKIFRSLEKYGHENHKFEVILRTTENYRLTAEALLGQYYNSLNGLNSKLPKVGDVSCISEETRRRLSEVNTGKKISESTRKKLIESHKTRIYKKCSEEKKIKIGLANKGKFTSEETKNRQSIKALGRKVSIETRQKISAGHKGSIKTDETKKRMSIAKKGTIMSAESIAKRLATMKINGFVLSHESIMKSVATRQKNGNCYKITSDSPIIMARKRLLLNIQTGIFYDSIADACKSVPHINVKYFRSMISGNNINKTSFIYA